MSAKKRNAVLPQSKANPVRAFVGYMAFNHVTGAMSLSKVWTSSARSYSAILNTIGKDCTLFRDQRSAQQWITRTIKNGREEYRRRQVRDGANNTDWRTSDWKWLFRQTWSVIPVFMALESEHLR